MHSIWPEPSMCPTKRCHLSINDGCHSSLFNAIRRPTTTNTVAFVSNHLVATDANRKPRPPIPECVGASRCHSDWSPSGNSLDANHPNNDRHRRNQTRDDQWPQTSMCPTKLSRCHSSTNDGHLSSLFNAIRQPTTAREECISSS